LKPHPRQLDVIRLGRVPYEAARKLQLDLVERRANDAIDDCLLLLEHDDVITVGRGADQAAAESAPFPVVEVERGGEATWHGPGQIVGYLIVKLEEAERDLHRVLRAVEEVVIETLRELGLAGARHPPHTGVWVGDRKVCSIGIAVKRWVTYHGFALNVRTDLAAYRTFKPCGLDAAVMDSLHRLTSVLPAVAAIETLLAQSTGAVFGRTVVYKSSADVPREREAP
jgi:lipoyl(octanoyl) transferase